MPRRRFLQWAASAAALLSAGRGAEPRRAPFRLLYGNDTTNIAGLQSPFHRGPAAFSEAMLKASIDEAAAADAHLLQPGLTFVPLWRSETYPAAEHFRWWQHTFPGSPLHPLGEYMLAGGDVVGVFVAHCRSRRIAPFVSLRLNDYHRTEFLDAPPGIRLDSFDSLAVDRFRREHPELRLQTGTGSGGPATSSRSLFNARDQSVLNWALPAVRARVLAFVAEIAGRYDIAGLELDFLRHFNLFRLPETTSRQRVEIVTTFVRDVRRTLDNGGAGRRLSLRIPALISMHDRLGLDVAALTAVGVDLFNLSSNYFTVQQDLDTAAIRRLAPKAAIYVEMTHTTMVGSDVTTGHGDNFLFRRTAPAEFFTTAELAAAQGADGVSLFNFAYYRGSGGASSALRGPFNEPPFDVLPALARRAFPGAPRSYFLAPAWRAPVQHQVQLPSKVGSTARAFHLDVTDAAGSRSGWLRVQTAEASGKGRWAAQLNGTPLPAVEADQVPRDAHPALRGTPETLAGWNVPAGIVQPGRNQVALSFDGAPVELVFVDLILS